MGALLFIKEVSDVTDFSKIRQRIYMADEDEKNYRVGSADCGSGCACIFLRFLFRAKGDGCGGLDGADALFGRQDTYEYFCI